jgi:hypothetical protein
MAHNPIVISNQDVRADFPPDWDKKTHLFGKPHSFKKQY